jgi:WD40 repeat protein
MVLCPVCQTEFREDNVERCSVCGWDLTPYPLTFPGQIPDAFVEKERAKLVWAKEMWAKFQAQLLKQELKERQRFQEDMDRILTRLEQQEKAPDTSAVDRIGEQLLAMQLELQAEREKQLSLLQNFLTLQHENKIAKKKDFEKLNSYVTAMQAQLEQIKQEQTQTQFQVSQQSESVENLNNYWKSKFMFDGFRFHFYSSSENSLDKIQNSDIQALQFMNSEKIAFIERSDKPKIILYDLTQNKKIEEFKTIDIYGKNHEILFDHPFLIHYQLFKKNILVWNLTTASPEYYLLNRISGSYKSLKLDHSILELVVSDDSGYVKIYNFDLTNPQNSEYALKKICFKVPEQPILSLTVSSNECFWVSKVSTYSFKIFQTQYDNKYSLLLEEFFGFRGNSCQLLFTPNNEYFVAIDSFTVFVYNLKTNQIAYKWNFNSIVTPPTIRFAVISNNSKILAISFFQYYEDRGSNIVTLFWLKTGEEIRTISIDYEVNTMAISPDGRTLVTGGEGIQFWSIPAEAYDS